LRRQFFTVRRCDSIIYRRETPAKAKKSNQIIMFETKIEFYQSILEPLNYYNIDIQNLIIRFEEGILELNNIDKIYFPNIESKCLIKVIDKLPDEVNKYWQLFNHLRQERKIVFLKFEMSSDFQEWYENIMKDEDNRFSNTREFVHNELDLWIKEDILEIFEQDIYHFLSILNLSLIGAYQYGNGFFFQDSKFIRVEKFSNFYPIELLEYSEDKKWPVFLDLSIKSCWDWFLQKIHTDTDTDTTNVQRAYNAYTHIVKNSKNIESIFWAMIGIEALYVTGKEGIGEQVRKKSQLFLGKIQEFKNMLSKMYDFRSSLVHGSKNIPSAFFNWNMIEDDIAKFYEDSNEPSLCAISLLIASLQKLITLNWGEINFDYKIVERSTE
jgi:hypothetical protein